MSRSSTSRGVLTIDDLRNKAERRSEERIARQRAIEILPCTSSQKWDFKTVVLSDCSLHGLAMLSDEPMRRGEEFLAKLKVKRMTMVLYRVAHCEQIDQFQYKIGAKLVEFVGTPDEILQGLLDEAGSPPKSR